jgi:uncharacterized protein (UPF0548 family)
VHSRAGLQVHASDISLRNESVVLMRWGLGALSLKIPCRVLHVMTHRFLQALDRLWATS